MATRLLWQHLFWFFGHPEVYIIFLPATGLRQRHHRDLLPAPGVRASGRRAGARSRPASSPSACGSTTCSRPACRASATASTPSASMTVAIPTGLQIFCWLATMWDGRPRFQVPMLYVVGFIVTFVIGGLTGVIIAAVPLDLAAPRHLLHRRPFPLRADRRRGVPAARHPHLLVPEDHRPDDERDARQDQLLDGLPRLPARLLPDALLRPARHAAAGLHLPRGPRARASQPALDDRRVRRRRGGR